MQHHFSKMVVLAGLSVPLGAVQSEPPAEPTSTMTVHDGAEASHAGYVNHDDGAIAGVFEGTGDDNCADATVVPITVGATREAVTRRHSLKTRGSYRLAEIEGFHVAFLV